MSKKAISVLLALAFALVLAFPAYAAPNLYLQVNGGDFDLNDMCIINNYSMISVESFAYLTGGDIEQTTDDDFVITGNGRSVLMSVGNYKATYNSGTIALPVAPVRIDGKIYIPLRAVSNAFDFTVDWDGDLRLVSIDRTEIRDGITALDMLVKSTLAQKEINTWRLDGTYNVDIDAKIDDESLMEGENLALTVKMVGEMQIDPFRAYIKQYMGGMEGLNELTAVESYIDEDRIYSKVNGSNWMYMESSMVKELMNQQMGLMSDPLSLTAFMRDMHKMIVYGNDVNIDGTDYYVVNAFFDAAAYADKSIDIIKQLTAGMSDIDEESMEMVALMLKNMQIDGCYSALINKETFISDICKFDLKITLPINMSDLLGADAMDGSDADEFLNQSILMEMLMKGSIKVFDQDGIFHEPDVSGAVSISEMGAGAVSGGAKGESAPDGSENGDAIDGDTPDGDAPDGDAPDGDTPDGDDAPGEDAPGEVTP